MEDKATACSVVFSWEGSGGRGGFQPDESKRNDHICNTIFMYRAVVIIIILVKGTISRRTSSYPLPSRLMSHIS